MVAAYNALLGRQTLALCTTVAACSAVWLGPESLAGNPGLSWMLFIALALIPGAMFYTARRIQSYCTSPAAQLRKAISANELDINYQPIINLRTGKLVGAQSLSRWSLNGVAIPGDVFIAAAEKSDLICELTRSVIRRVAEDYCTHLWACKDFYITINLSAQDILDPTFPDFVANILATYNLPASVMVFEVTEKAFLSPISAATQLNRLRACGHRIAIVDVGSSYSGLAFIESVPVDILKIDLAFITQDALAAKDALWRDIARIARTLELNVVAEGVDTQQQLPQLVSEGVVLAQGWLFSQELPVHALARRYFSMSGEHQFFHGLK
jgi:sensor c-di-GMP phosphodiesterase-like protein